MALKSKNKWYLTLAFLLLVFPLFIPRLFLNKNVLLYLGIWEWSIKNYISVLVYLGLLTLSSFGFSLFYYHRSGYTNDVAKILYYVLFGIDILLIIAASIMLSKLHASFIK